MSTIKVDTYLTRGGASEIAIDKLKGASSASSISVVAEGGTNTTNLQQGLNKTWINLNGTGTIATRDSFNVTSITDNSTGDYTITIATDMASGDYTVATNAGDNEVAVLGCVFLNSASAPAAGSVRIRGTASNGDAIDHTYVMIQIAGDLA